MPSGTYEHLDADGRVRLTERFRCAAGGSGWRYVSRLSTSDGHDAGSVDLTLDLHGRQLRVAVDLGGWSLRGGCSGPELLWVRRTAGDGPTDSPEHRERATGFAGVSPAFFVAAAAVVPRDGDTVRLRLVSLSGVLGARTEDQRWRLAGVESHHVDGAHANGAAFDVSAYEVLDADTAERETVHIAGDVVLAASLFVLADLDSPPGSALHNVQ
ncbi:MAG: hypothetical protein H0V10_15580 [Geodermatophilaceae bacterium]|nr:hypothetical protein [Geodermatophilaceae bacterium]